MLNLYQNQRLTKEIIELGQLEKCKLAFWLCVKENGNYKSISKESYSCIITESKIYLDFFPLLIFLFFLGKKKKSKYPP